MSGLRLPVTALVAVRNEAANLPACLRALAPAARVVVLDSHSTDGTPDIARSAGAEVVQFDYAGGYPKKRQWALERVAVDTPWILFVDADEEVPPPLWNEIARELARPDAAAGYLAVKQFHFLGRRLRFGGFSHAAVLLIRTGRARFERLLEDPADGLDMEVHERVIVDGPVARLRTALVHNDRKGLDAYRARHARYADWESRLRHAALSTGRYGAEAVEPRLWGNAQERRRFLKRLAMRMPGEPAWWFAYHYLLRLGFLEGRAGWLASLIRMQYIRDVRRRVRLLAEAPPTG